MNCSKTLDLKTASYEKEITPKLELRFAERNSDNQIIHMQDDEISNLNTLLKFAELQKNLRGVNIDDTSQTR